jgi:predicted nucleic acid-binding protein
MIYVIDCSFSSALFLPDEKSDAVRDFFIKLKKNDQLFIPLLWWYETINVINVSLKRKRINYNDSTSIINLMNELKLMTDFEYGIELAKRIFELTQLYNISSYDAVYLELSIRKKARLRTLDNDLLIAAKNIGIDM